MVERLLTRQRVTGLIPISALAPTKSTLAAKIAQSSHWSNRCARSSLRKKGVPMKTGNISFWYETMGRPAPRPPLKGDINTDVCIIGAGFTGLWAAYYLKQADPSLRVVIVERDFAGFGASGRNGGWLTGGFAWNHAR